MEKEKKPDFVVNDRRMFNVDGELRPGATVEPPAPVAPTPVNAPASQSTVTTSGAASKPERTPDQTPTNKQATNKQPVEPFVPDLITETGYNGEQERTAFGGQKMEFIHLLDMLVQTAMMYAGAMEGGTEKRVDIVGLRQMIDLISVLEEKTKGNLTEQEQSILTNTVFQLRMTYMEIVNMIEREALQKTPGAPGAPRK